MNVNVASEKNGNICSPVSFGSSVSYPLSPRSNGLRLIVANSDLLSSLHRRPFQIEPSRREGRGKNERAICASGQQMDPQMDNDQRGVASSPRTCGIFAMDDDANVDKAETVSFPSDSDTNCGHVTTPCAHFGFCSPNGQLFPATTLRQKLPPDSESELCEWQQKLLSRCPTFWLSIKQGPI